LDIVQPSLFLCKVEVLYSEWQAWQELLRQLGIKFYAKNW